MRLAIIDCETTGIEDDDEPISLGVVVVELGADGVGYPQARIYQEREPSIAISPDAELVHGLTSFALHGKSFDKSIILETMADTECVVSHNARFDARMLAKVLPEALSWSWRCTLKQRPLTFHRAAFKLSVNGSASRGRRYTTHYQTQRRCSKH